MDETLKEYIKWHIKYLLTNYNFVKCLNPSDPEYSLSSDWSRPIYHWLYKITYWHYYSDILQRLFEQVYIHDEIELSDNFHSTSGINQIQEAMLETFDYHTDYYIDSYIECYIEDLNTEEIFEDLILILNIYIINL